MDQPRFDRLARILGSAATRRAAVRGVLAGMTGIGVLGVAEAGPSRRHEKLACRNANAECTSGEQCCSGSCVPRFGGTGFRCARAHGGKKKNKKSGGSGGDTPVVDCTAAMVCASGCPYTSIQQAIDVVLDGPGPWTITIGPGEYVEDLTSAYNDSFVLSGLDGCPNPVVYNASDGQRNYLNSGSNTQTLEIRNVTMARNQQWAIGGGVDTQGNLTLSGTTILRDGTRSGYDEGGCARVGNSETGNFVMQDDALIEGCSANEGGGVFTDSYSTALLTDNAIIRDCVAEKGGGIFVYYEASLIMEGNASVTGNTANDGQGGGVHVYGFLDGTCLTMRGNASVTNNATTAQGGDGGGVFVGPCVSTLEDAAEISGNSATGDGGGIYVEGTLNQGSGVIFANNTPNNCAGAGCP